MLSASTSIFMKPRVSPASRAPDPGHHPLTHQHVLSRCLRLPCRHADAAQWRVDEQSVAENPVARPARLVVEQVCVHNLIVVVTGMGEGTSAIHLSDRPDTFDTGSQCLVNTDETAIVDIYPGVIQSQVIGIRPAAHRQQQVAAIDGRCIELAVDFHTHTTRALLETLAPGLQPHRDTLPREDVTHRVRDVLIFSRNEPVLHLDHSYLRAETAIHRRVVFHAVLGSTPREVGHPGTRDQRLGGIQPVLTHAPPSR